MSPDTGDPSPRTVLLVGASRGLGLAMAAEFLKRRWQVIGTVRAATGTGLHDLARIHQQIAIETVDIDEPAQIAALRHRLAATRLDMLFVNAGVTTHDPNAQVDDVTTDDFVRVMTTNALSPMRVIAALADLVPASGLIGAMSSGQGSIANNQNGVRDVYRASKAALNMFMQGFAARHTASARAMVLMAPGWVRTDLGGPSAPFGLDESVPAVVDVLIATIGSPGLHYLDRFGQTVPW